MRLCISSDQIAQALHKLCASSKVSTTPSSNENTCSRQSGHELRNHSRSPTKLPSSPHTRLESRSPSNSQSSICSGQTTPSPSSYEQLHNMLSALQNPRQAAAQLLNFGLILSTAFMMWKGLSVISDSPSPIVVVLSGSMEPAFQRGDLLFLWNRNLMEETKVGEIVVYNVKGKDIPIVHRLVRKFGTG